MISKWSDLTEKALTGTPECEASLSEIYDKVFAMPEARSKMGKNPVDYKAQIRCQLQRDERFSKAGTKGWWRLVKAGEARVEKIREEIKDTKLKRYRLRKETAILKFFERSDSGTNQQIIYWINKNLKNCYGRPIRHGEMSARECGQVLKRMHFIRKNKVWYPPGAKPVEESVESEEEGKWRRQKW
jgi:hypothetical protein